MSDVKPGEIADVIEGAAAHIEQYGWVSGEFFQLKNDLDPRACPVCVRGGLAVATGRHPEFVANWPLHADLDGGFIASESAAADLIQAAEGVFAWYLIESDTWADLGDVTAEIEEWNDADGRTADEVIAALRACAAELRKAPFEGGEAG